MTKPVPQWQVPNQLNVHAITGTAETLSIPKPGLLNYFPKDRPTLSNYKPIDVSTYQTPTSAQAFDQLLNVPTKPVVPSVKEQVKEAIHQREQEFQKWTHWLPIGATWPTNIGDTATIGDTLVEPLGKEADIPKKTWEVPPIPFPPPPPPGEPPDKPRNPSILEYPLWGHALTIKVRKRKTKRLLQPGSKIRSKNNGPQRSYRSKASYLRWLDYS